MHHTAASHTERRVGKRVLRSRPGSGTARQFLTVTFRKKFQKDGLILINEKCREAQFKLMHREMYGYDIPSDPNAPDRKTSCPKFPKKKRTSHMVFGPVLSLTGCRVIQDALNISIPFEPQPLLFQYFSIPVRNSQLIYTFLLLAKRCLSSNQEVIRQVKQYITMDRIKRVLKKMKTLYLLFSRYQRNHTNWKTISLLISQ